jgi:hypothetical protein
VSVATVFIAAYDDMVPLDALEDLSACLLG